MNKGLFIRPSHRFTLSRSSLVMVVSVLALLLVSCDNDNKRRPDYESRDDTGTPTQEDASAPGQDSGPDSGPNRTDTGSPDGGQPDDDSNCTLATGREMSTTEQIEETYGQAVVSVEGAPGCARTFTLATTAPLRHGLPANPRVVRERSGGPGVQTSSPLFDALYVLAIEEMEENAVDSVRDGAFNHGEPMPCGRGGCFETGRLWHYIWTRDIAYSVHLALAALDPLRSANSMRFKLSPRRDSHNEGPQIVQDTGTGGSYPISSDRAVWAIGAWELLKFLDGEDRQAFAMQSFEAMENTILHDREVVFDPEDGLYRGEQSFLDWREQSYPQWTSTNNVHIGMSKALSTNIGHLRLLESAAALAEENGFSERHTQFGLWADNLREAIRERFYLEEEGLYSTFITTYLDGAPVRHFDLLGSALAILFEVATPQQASHMLSQYPHTTKGPPVIWPQQKEVPIYHNRGIWPFVTAYWLKAAKEVGNWAVVNNNVQSLMVGAALNLSNMENFEMVTGMAWLDDGDYAGPVVNSQRQLWSVAGYLSMVHDIFFGLQAQQHGLRFAPFITTKIRNTLFGGADNLVLNNFPYKGKSLTVVLHLPPPNGQADGALVIEGVRLNDNSVGIDELVTSAQLQDQQQGINLLEIDLAYPQSPGNATINVVTQTQDYRLLFAPKNPVVTQVQEVGERLEVAFHPNGEIPAEIRFNIYRDGQMVAQNIAGSETVWRDPDTAGSASPSHCYTAESVFLISGNTSQRSEPVCYWGPNHDRAIHVLAEDLQHVGGTWVHYHGYAHYEAWGDPGHSLTLSDFVPPRTGPYLLQVMAANGAGPYSSGITCGVKRIRVEEMGTQAQVASGYLLMPHLGGDWSQLRDSSFVRANLEAGKSYRIVIDSDQYAVNMSVFEHFSHYTAGLGGEDAPFNRVNIASLKILSLTGDEQDEQE